MQERTNCLSRDAVLIQSHNGLRRNRKALLSELSSLVKTARRIEAAVNERTIMQIEDEMCDEMITKAFKTVVRAVKLFDIWVEDVMALSTDGRTDNGMEDRQIDPCTQVLLAEGSKSGHVDCLQESIMPASLTTCQIGQANINNLDKNAADHLKETEQTNSRPCLNRSSFTYMRHGVSGSIRCQESSASEQIKATSVTHRPSSSVFASGASRLNLASIKLSTAHDLFLGCLGSFIGLHLESRSSSDLLATTQQAVISCRNMLQIIEAIWDRDARRSDTLGQARENMYSSITNLAEAARNIFTPARPGDVIEIHVVQTDKSMVDAATECVRAAGECVAESQFVLDRLGDFHFEPLQVEFATLKDGKPPVDNLISAVVECKEDLPSTDDTLLPLEPPTRPPPPPQEAAIHPSAARQEDTVASDKMLAKEGLKQLHVRTHSLLPPLPPFAGLLPSYELNAVSHGETQSNHSIHLRADSFDCASAGGSSTFIGSMRDSETSAVSESSTRATSPEVACTETTETSPIYDAMSFSQTTLNDDVDETEVAIQQKTFAHEIIYNKDGQISGGTLPALIERLTTHDSTPDATFVATFLLNVPSLYYTNRLCPSAHRPIYLCRR